MHPDSGIFDKLSIELRNQRLGVPTLLGDEESNMNECVMRVLIHLPGVRDLWNVGGAG